MPVVWRAAVGRYHILDAAAVGAARGQSLQRLGDNVLDVVAHECQSVHRRHIYSAVPSVAVVHYVSRAVAYLRGGVGHGGRHETREVGLDLEVDVVGVGIVTPVARCRGHHAVEYVVACRLVGVPQRVTGVGKGRGHRVGGGVDAQAVDHRNEGQVHVYVVVDPGGIEHRRAHVVGIAPRDFHFVADETLRMAELGRAAVGYAYRLAGPAALDLVEQFGSRHGDGARLRGAGRGGYFVPRRPRGVACGRDKANR